jgi:hypothetical protein
MLSPALADIRIYDFGVESRAKNEGMRTNLSEVAC